VFVEGDFNVEPDVQPFVGTDVDVDREPEPLSGARAACAENIGDLKKVAVA
jgi:hypothetical protein